MHMKNLLACGVAASVLVAAPANAGVTINLVEGTFTGTPAQIAKFKAGFQLAAAYWSSILTNTATINLRVGTASLAAGVIGSTGSTKADYTVATWENRVNATKSGSTIDQTVLLPTLNGGGGASFITNGVNNVTHNDDLTTLRYDDGTTLSSSLLYLNTAVIKAIGGTASGVNNASIDGSVTFSSNFGFDFDPTDGITANTFDFIGVAIHEIGHALGFVSGVDFLDQTGEGPGNSPYEGILGYSANDTSIYSALDMFRYSSDPTNVVPGTGAVRDLSAGTVSGAKFFSIDGGATALFGNTFAQGAYNGDGNQASHWKDTPGCQIGNGIMDPTFCFGQTGYITGLDLAAFDAMGWNLSTNALTYANTSTAKIYQALLPVPEPSTWAMMIVGFGLMGGAMRRNRKVTARIRFA